jgi:UTP--glucose-1-phosphate uridylyltransferase
LTFVDQPLPLGTGEAIYRARRYLGDEPFALMMPDFVFFGDTSALGQMIPLYERFEKDIVGLMHISGKEARGFGNVGIAQGEETKPGVVEIHELSEKIPDPISLREDEKILKAVARWIIGPHFFSYLEKTKEKDEWDDTPALQLICKEKKALGKILDGRGFDVGNPVGYEAAETFATFRSNRYGT